MGRIEQRLAGLERRAVAPGKGWRVFYLGEDGLYQEDWTAQASTAYTEAELDGLAAQGWQIVIVRYEPMATELTDTEG